MPLRILIVDDSEATRSLIRDLAESDGHQVVAEAESPETALKAFAEHKPDFVTLDFSLKDGNGLDVLKSMRAQDAKVKILAVTGNSQRIVRESILAAGAKLLPKPIDFAALQAAFAEAAAAP